MPLCPECSNELLPVDQDQPKMLNADQFDSVKAGDWYCKVCHGNQGKTSHRYFWNSELEATPAKNRFDDTAWKIVRMAVPLVAGQMQDPTKFVHNELAGKIADILRREFRDNETATLCMKVERFRKALKWIKGRFPFSRWSTADGTGHWHCRSCGTDMEIDDPKHEPDCPVGILIEAATGEGG